MNQDPRTLRISKGHVIQMAIQEDIFLVDPQTFCKTDNGMNLTQVDGQFDVLYLVGSMQLNTFRTRSSLRLALMVVFSIKKCNSWQPATRFFSISIFVEFRKTVIVNATGPVWINLLNMRY